MKQAPSSAARKARPFSGRLVLPFSIAFLLGGAPVLAQLKSPSDRLDDLEKQVARQEKELAKLREERKEAKKKEEAEVLPGGLLTLGGVKLRLAGKAELLFVDSEEDFFAPLGANGFTREPDPHLIFQRLRLEPLFELNRWISLRAQLDLEPITGETLLKEAVARHDIRPAWWFDSRFQIGLDDRFIRPARRTKTYPLIGTAFWRDESLALTWRLRFGDRDGRPPDRVPAPKERLPKVLQDGAGTEGFAVEPPAEAAPGAPSPFDFARNWGAPQLFLSLGQGYVLDSKVIGFDRARFNRIVQDDRELETDLSLRELGIGLGWVRSFRELGELSLLGFYYNDELRPASIAFLQGPEMTVPPLPGQAEPQAGYGTSANDNSYRYGGSAEYFLPASTLFDGILPTRRADGLRLFYQYILGVDGDLERKGWYAQASYRVSFPSLLAGRYFRSIEPLVRYGTFDVGVPLGPHPTLPGTWDRKQLLLGAIVEVTGDIFIKAEYAFNREDTGAGKIDNNELLIELLLRF
jgi:hypothetical protein